MPCETCKSSPGYSHARDWGETLSVEYSKYIQEDSSSSTASSSFHSSELDDETPIDASFVEKMSCLVAVDSDAVSTSCESTPYLVPTSIAASVASDSGSIEVDHVDEPLELPPSSLIDEEHLVRPSNGHLVVSSVAEVAAEALATAKEAANAAHEAAKAAQIAAQAAASAAVVAAKLAQTAEKLATLAKPDAPLANTHQSMAHSPAQLAQISPIEGIEGVNFFMNAVSKFLGFWVMSVMPVTSVFSTIMRRLHLGRSLSC
jgi:hypothetical protein